MEKVSEPGDPISGESFSVPDASTFESSEAVSTAEIALPARKVAKIIEALSTISNDGFGTPQSIAIDDDGWVPIVAS